MRILVDVCRDFDSETGGAPGTGRIAGFVKKDGSS